MRLVVVGAGGQLGAAIVHECAGKHDVTGLTRAQLDITDDRAIVNAIETAKADAVINCAAFNEVDLAEDRPTDALAVNAFAVRALALAAEDMGAAFVHYSTDFVFDGTATKPYAETDSPSPRSVYGASKLLGEWFALDAPRAYVLRVESLFGQSPGGPAPRGTVAAIAKGLLAGTSPKVFRDRTVSPTCIADAAHATRVLLESSPPPGIYHCVNSGFCTWLEFAIELAKRLNVDPKLTDVAMADVPLRAERPRFCALSNEKLRDIGIDMPSWQDAVSRFAADRV